MTTSFNCSQRVLFDWTGTWDREHRGGRWQVLVFGERQETTTTIGLSGRFGNSQCWC
jgi:hypothetical protein